MMGIFSKLEEKRQSYLDKKYEKKAKNLTKLKEKRIKYEGRANIASIEDKEKARIAKAQGYLKERNVKGFKKAFSNVTKVAKGTKEFAKNLTKGFENEKLSLKTKDVYGFKGDKK